MACQVQPGSPPSYFSTGTQDSASFVTDSTTGALTLQYSATTDTTRTTYITLTCDPNQDPGQVTAAGEDPTIQAEYKMAYTGKYACPSSEPAPPSGGDSGGLSVGSILCIVFFSLVIVYVAVGIVVQIFVRKASGKEIIPQVGFWSSLPGLVKSCQVQPGSPPAYFNIGKQETATFKTSVDGKITLNYVDNTQDARNTVINLNCDKSQDPGTVTAQGETVPKQYTLTYTGKYACPESAPPVTTPKPGPGPGPRGLSVGSILCIVVFSTLIVYLAAGILIQKFVREASGKEMIPQYSLWSAAPGLIKDGVLFTVKRGRVGKPYDSI